MRAGWRAAVAMSALAVGVACTPDAGVEPTTGPRLPHDVVLLRTGEGVSGVDVRSGEVTFTAPASSVVVPGLESLVTTEGIGGATSVASHSLEDGRPLDEMEVDGEFVARVVSGSGHKVALMEPRTSGTSPYLPEARSMSRIVVADLVDATAKNYALTGNYEPEAFSTDDRRLFLIEYLPAMAPERYRVRILDLITGRLLSVGDLKGSAPGQMRGTGRTQVLSPDEEVLYTLYTRQGPNRAHGKTQPSASPHHPVYAFVHMLNLHEGWAHCIDLPPPFGTGIATASAVTTSWDGSRVYVADPSTGALAVIDPSRAKVVGTARLGVRDRSGETATATLDPSGDTLYVGFGETVSSFDARTLEPMDRWFLAAPALDLRTNVDGRMLYVAQPDRVSLLETTDGDEIGRLPVGAVEQLLDVWAAG